MEQVNNNIQLLSELKSSDLMSICFTCLKEVQAECKVSIFNKITPNSTPSTLTMTDVDKHLEMCVSDMISLCSSQITVNIHYRLTANKVSSWTSIMYCTLSIDIKQ